MMLDRLGPLFALRRRVPEQLEVSGGIPSLGEAGKKSVSATHALIAESKPGVPVVIPCSYNTDIKFGWFRLRYSLNRTVFGLPSVTPAVIIDPGAPNI